MEPSKRPLLVAVALPATLCVISTLSRATAAEPTPIPPGTPVTITVTQATPASPPASIILGARHGHVTPSRAGFTHTGGGNIDVAQPTPDVVVVTMTGVAVAGAHPCKDSLAAMSFDLTQSFEISFDSPKLTRAKLVLEGRVIGLLRSHDKGGGTAGEGPGCATILNNEISLVTLCVPQHGVACGENLSINDRESPVEIPISPGKYTLIQTFLVSAAHPKSLRPCKAASAEFAPDPALDPLWISYWEPFHGALKKDFGFQITIRVAEDTSPARK
ncbi:MAG TPA: hypothetical protein VGP76_27245 [Planctomycetaceae bacterium]|jgi:hypothetical protein|nr:hypothetical protein [Planctomycetaceae bacterium]